VKVLYWLTLALVVGVGCATHALAGSAQSYVQGLVGSWKGGGILVINQAGRKVKLRCVSKNTLIETKRTLKLKGKCAASSGRRKLSGRMVYSLDGSKLSSVALGLGAGTKTISSRLAGKTLTINGRAKAEDGQFRQTRSVIRGGGRKYTVGISVLEGSSWKKIGTLTFNR